MLPTTLAPPTQNSPPRSRKSYSTRKKKKLAAAESSADFISDLPDAMLMVIISLLPTKDGARTQILARRWLHLWRATPLKLNLRTKHSLFLGTNDLMTVSRILDSHPGPASHMSCPCIVLDRNKCKRLIASWQIDSWFCSPALTGLQELNLSFSTPWSIQMDDRDTRYTLPPSVFRLAPTLVVVEIGGCEFPKEISPSLRFPVLKKLSLYRVSIMDYILNAVLSGCHLLESLLLKKVSTNSGHFRVSSPTLRSIGFSDCGVLIIDDVPCLERLLVVFPGWATDQIVWVVKAPKLEIIGPFSPDIFLLQIANVYVLPGMIPAASLNNLTCTVKILALQFSSHSLSTVLDVLKCFPCLETLYVSLTSQGKSGMKNVCQYDPLQPINCLETRLQKLVLINYEGHNQDVGFAHFFILNAKVLKAIKFGVVNKKINKRWLAGQHKLLEMETREALDAQFHITSGYPCFSKTLDIHDLSVADPFEQCFINDN